MATLTANISSTAGQIAVSGDVSGARTREEYRIDDEVITLRKFVRELDGVPNPWGQLNRTKWIVSRGMSGTTAASHLAGAAIVGTEDAVTTGTTLTPPEPFAGEGASEQTMTLLGPFTITFADIIAAGNGIWFDIADLDQGSVVVKVWPVIRTAFADATNGFLYAGAGVPGGNYTGGITLAPGYPGGTISVITGVEAEPFLGVNTSPPASAVITGSGIKLMVLYEANDLLGLTGGEADIYALIATPS